MRIRLICNCHRNPPGGGEMSSAWIAKKLASRGHHVEVVPTYGVDANYAAKSLCIDPLGTPGDGCDVMVGYMNNAVLELEQRKEAWQNETRCADRVKIVCNWGIGEAVAPWFRREVNDWAFLCTELRKQMPVDDAVVMAPPVDLSTFLFADVDYERSVVVRHDKPGKIERRTWEVWRRVHEQMPDATFETLGVGNAPVNGVTCWPAYSIHPVEVLARGRCYLHVLRKGFADQGPRTIVEAMAAGLPVICENRWGAADRVTDETGWLCNNDDEIVQAVVEALSSPTMCKQKGRAARERARSEFDPMRWIDWIER